MQRLILLSKLSLFLTVILFIVNILGTGQLSWFLILLPIIIIMLSILTVVLGLLLIIAIFMKIGETK